MGKTTSGVTPVRTVFIIPVLAVTMLLAACSPAAPATATSMPAATPVVPTVAPATDTPAATQVPTEAMAATTSEPTGQAVPTALDPCQLIPSAEASSLAGASFGDGTEGTLTGGGRTCTYGSQSTNIFYVEVVQAADENTAESAQTQFIDDLNANMQKLSSAGFTITQISDFADGAVSGSVNISAGGASIGGSAFGFRKGTVFVGFSEVAVGSPALSVDVMQNEANTVLGRLP